MKKPTKRKPKSKPKLKKYSYGGGNPVASASDQEQIDAQYYRDQKSSGMSADQYAALGSGLVQAGSAISSANNSNMTDDQKAKATSNGINSAVDSTAGALTPWYAYAKAGSDMGRSMVSRDENGVPKSSTDKQMDAVMKPHHEMIIEDASKGNWGLAAAELLLPGIGYESRSNSLGLQKDINKLFGSDNATNYQYPYGGSIGAPNAELEKQEVVRMPDGSTGQVNGPSHEQGGVPVSLPPNTQVFSDKLKLPGSKETIAKVAEQYKSDKEEKVLANDKSTNMAKATAKLIAEVKQRKLDNLYQAQEQLKMSKVAKYAEKMGVTLPQSMPQMRNGGAVNLPSYARYDNGGPIKSYQEDVDDINNRYANTMYDSNISRDDAQKQWFADTNNYDPTTGESYRSARNRFNERYDRQDVVPGQPTMSEPGTNGSNPNIPYAEIAGNSASFLAQNAGNLWDLKRSEMGTKYDKENYGSVNPTLLDDKEALRDADIQGRVTRDRLKDMTNGNVGAYLSNLGSAQTANTLNKARIREQFQNTNAGISNQAKYFNKNLEVKQMNDTSANKARSEDLAAHAVRDIGSKSASSYKDYKSGEVDQKKLSLISQYFPDYNFDPNTYEFYYRAAQSKQGAPKSRPTTKKTK